MKILDFENTMAIIERYVKDHSITVKISHDIKKELLTDGEISK